MTLELRWPLPSARASRDDDGASACSDCSIRLYRRPLSRLLAGFNPFPSLLSCGRVGPAEAALQRPGDRPTSRRVPDKVTDVNSEISCRVG